MGWKYVTLCMGYQQITSLSSSTGMTVPTNGPNGLSAKPTLAVIIPEAQAVRWRDDGTAPTASVGMPLAVSQPLHYDGDLTKIRFIEQVSGAKINIAYYV
jgi:hypothetical protein